MILIFHPPAADRSRDSPREFAPIVRGWNIVSTSWKKIIQKVPWKKNNIKRHLQAWDMSCLSLSMTQKTHQCFDIRKKKARNSIKSHQSREKLLVFLISLRWYIDTFPILFRWTVIPFFLDHRRTVRRWWLEVWWRVRKPWDQKLLLLGEVVEGKGAMIWLSCLFGTERSDISVIYFEYEFLMWYIFEYEFLMFNTFTSMWYVTCLELSVMHFLYKRRSVY